MSERIGLGRNEKRSTSNKEIPSAYNLRRMRSWHLQSEVSKSGTWKKANLISFGFISTVKFKWKSCQATRKGWRHDQTRSQTLCLLPPSPTPAASPVSKGLMKNAIILKFTYHAEGLRCLSPIKPSQQSVLWKKFYSPLHNWIIS